MNVDDGVVLAVIQITDDQVPNGQHLRVQHTYGQRDVSSFLIQQWGEGEVDEDPAARRRGGGCSRAPAGLRQATTGGGRGVAGGGRRQDSGCGCPSSTPPLYRPPGGGGAGPGDGNLPRGRRPGGWSAPQGKWCAPHLGFPTLGVGGAQGGAHQPTRGWFPSHLSPRGPSG